MTLNCVLHTVMLTSAIADIISLGGFQIHKMEIAVLMLHVYRIGKILKEPYQTLAELRELLQ